MNLLQFTMSYYKNFFLLSIAIMVSIGSSFAQVQKIQIFDCEKHEPISDVQIFTESQRYLGATDENGKANLEHLGKEKINFKKLGYEPLMLNVDQLNNICLNKKEATLSDVSIRFKRSNFYDTLIDLRNKNKPDFLDYEGILTFSFTYKTVALEDNSLMDEGTGYFTVRYQKNYTYPNLFSNSNDYAKVIAFNYKANPKLSARTLESIKYLDPSTLVCCYDVMENKFGTKDWWNYNNLEVGRETKYYIESDGGRKFVTYRSDSTISRNFYFDKNDKIQKVEFLKPTYFYDSNYDKDKTKFFVQISYSNTVPKVANKYEYAYEFNSDELAYKTTLNIEQCYPQKQTLIIPDAQQKNTVFSLIGSFYELNNQIIDAKAKLNK